MASSTLASESVENILEYAQRTTGYSPLLVEPEFVPELVPEEEPAPPQAVRLASVEAANNKAMVFFIVFSPLHLIFEPFGRISFRPLTALA